MLSSHLLSRLTLSFYKPIIMDKKITHFSQSGVFRGVDPIGRVAQNLG